MAASICSAVVRQQSRKFAVQYFQALERVDMFSTSSKDSVYGDTNMPRTPEGRVLHLEVKSGDVANRILSVGDPERAKRLAAYFDNDQEVFVRSSGRGFVTYTGTYSKVPVSIISTGMGMPMMDFVVREARGVVDGNMAIIRYGSCGGVRPDVPVGSIVVASEGSVSVVRDPDVVHSPVAVPRTTPFGACSESPYRISQTVLPDAAMTEALLRELRGRVGSTAQPGMNATGCSFYSSQGRVDPQFDDRNASLLPRLESLFPSLASLEMETFHLLDLARSSRGTIRASGAAIILAHRHSEAVMTHEEMAAAEREGGQAVLATLAATQL